MQTPELLQFPYSHFCEKARWALDWKRLPHRRRSYLPGPHAPAVARLTGQAQVPVLRVDGGFTCGSARILDELERLQPAPPLYPKDPIDRARALEIQARFDEHWGPLVRRALFSRLLGEPGYLTRVFASSRPLPMRALYRASVPLVGGLMRRGMGISDAASVEEAFAGTREALDFVAAEAGPSGHLVGDAFGVADLSAASLLAPTVMPEGSPMCLPKPRPALLEDWLATWADHDGAAWVRETYARHRPDSAELS